MGRLYCGIDVKISPEMYNSLCGLMDFLLRRCRPLCLLHGFFLNEEHEEKMPAASLLLHEKILNLIQVKVLHDAYLVRLNSLC